MTALRVIAIDDEPLALRRLEWCLQDMPGIVLVGKTGDPQHGLEMIRTLAPDVVLLDVEMPELTGFELIESLGTLNDIALPEIRSSAAVCTRRSSVPAFVASCGTHRRACKSCARSSIACVPSGAAAAHKRSMRPSCGSVKATRAYAFPCR
jgi:CheY-like chemotaxis protein